MRTEELIHLLAADDRPVYRPFIEQRFAVATVAGIAGAVVLMLTLFGLRPGLLASMSLPMFCTAWIVYSFGRIPGMDIHDREQPGIRYAKS